jgi:hypothetical protein
MADGLEYCSGVSIADIWSRADGSLVLVHWGGSPSSLVRLHTRTSDFRRGSFL